MNQIVSYYTFFSFKELFLKTSLGLDLQELDD